MEENSGELAANKPPKIVKTRSYPEDCNQVINSHCYNLRTLHYVKNN